MQTVIAIDPGSSKCGVAVVRKNEEGVGCEVLSRSVVASRDLEKIIGDLSARFSPDAIIVGGGTTSPEAADIVRRLQTAPVEVVDEKFSSLQARKRYFRENPPRGIRRLIPISLQTPSEPYDDWVAVILAERYLS